MLTARTARPGSFGVLLAVTAAVTVAAVTACPVPARADSVRSDQQWVLDAVKAPGAWPLSQGSGVTVAVIDSGVVPTVDDLAGSVTTGPDLSGVSTPSTDPNWGMHGTWMASLIAGHGHGSAAGDGVSGVAPQAKVLSIRVLPDKKDPAYSQYQHEPARRGQRALARAITYAVSHHVGVISMSLGYGASSRVVRAALQDATRHNVVVVASSGNFGNSSGGDQGQAHAPYSFPADYPGVLGVAAVSRAGKSAKFSSDNLSVQVAAPGVKVPAQGSDGGYWLVSGTSPACALTAGVAALIKAKYPDLSPALVIRAITSSTQNRPPGGYDDRVGFGTVNAVAALAAAAQLTIYRTAGHGVRPHAHFGGGPPAIPPSPIQPRGPASLVLFGLLALACLVLAIVAAARLRRGRRAAHAGPLSPAPAGGAPPGACQPSRYEPAPTPVRRAST
jgi:subtilisin family serine protease